MRAKPSPRSSPSATAPWMQPIARSASCRRRRPDVRRTRCSPSIARTSSTCVSTVATAGFWSAPGMRLRRGQALDGDDQRGDLGLAEQPAQTAQRGEGIGRELATARRYG